MTTFRIHQDVAAVEHDDDGSPLDGGQILPATITGAGEYSARDRLWREGGRWRLVPLCCCDEPVTGTPVTVGNDPLDRIWCSEECRDADSEGAYEQGYQPGVAT